MLLGKLQGRENAFTVMCSKTTMYEVDPHSSYPCCSRVSCIYIVKIVGDVLCHGFKLG